MGNFQQHERWALYTFILLVLVTVQIEELTLKTYEYLLLLIMFMLGTISPDIDLAKENRITRIVYKIVYPIVIGTGYGIGIWRLVVFEEKYIFLSVIVGIGIVFCFVSVVDRSSKHWGLTHSMGFLIILSTITHLAIVGFYGRNVLMFTFGFALGYLNHLICDQIYHTIRGKHWKSPHYAIKLWSNNWRYDPLIILCRIFRKIR